MGRRRIDRVCSGAHLCQIKEEGEARSIAAQEQRRLREKDQLQFRALESERQSTIEQLKRDVRQGHIDRNALESKLVAALSDQEASSAQVRRSERAMRVSVPLLSAFRSLKCAVAIYMLMS